MNSESIDLSALICDSLNSIFFKIFSSIDNVIYSNLDNILFINTDIVNDSKFQSIFGSNSSNGFLLIANSLIFGLVIFYILNFAMSHLIYSKIDSPYQFAFKTIIFIACMNSSLWICEQIINIVSLISSSICDINISINGNVANFSSLIENINNALYPTVETFDIFSLDGVIKLFTTIAITFILITYSVRYIMCKILILLSPFAFASLITNRTDGFFKGWLKQFLILLSMQIFVSVILVLGFSLNFYAGDVLSKLFFLAIILIIAKCQYSVKEYFSFIYSYSHNTLKKFV